MENQAHLFSDSTILGTTARQSTSNTRLNGWQLMTARGVWAVISVAALVVFALALPVYFERLLMQTTLPQGDNLQLFPQDLLTLMQFGLPIQSYAGYLSALQVIILVVYLFIGVLIFRRKSADRTTIITSMMLITLGAFAGALPIELVLVQHNPALYDVVQLLVSLNRTALLLFLCIFPDGHFTPRWTRWTTLLWAVINLLPLVTPESALNPYNWSLVGVLTYYVVLFSTGIYAQVYRYRNGSDAVQRQQTKWVVVGIVLTFTGAVAIPAVFIAAVPAVTESGSGHLLFNLIYQTLYALAHIVFVVALTFSLLRYRLWDVDLVLNRSLVYGALTIVLGLIFAISALILQAVFNLLTMGSQSPLALTISALVIGGLFQPARRRLQRFVDYRFYHLRVDLNQLNATPPGVVNPGALTGQSFGPYQLLEPLGRGGMSEVYKGLHPTLGRSVAVKILPPHLAAEEGFRKRFEREARTVATLKHPNIVNVFDFGVMDGISYMVMEFINGHDLGDMLNECGKLSPVEALPIIRDVAAALDYAHGQNIVHRDIKPSNIMLEVVTQPGYEKPYRAILTDFGIARIITDGSGLTKTGMMGTLDYIAPEQIIEAKKVDARADIYALGVMTYQMLTGKLPFQGENAGSILFGHLQRPAPDARNAAPELPESVAKAIQKAMAKAPNQRFQSAGDFAAALAGEEVFSSLSELLA